MIISLSKNLPKTFNINLNRNILTKEVQQFINDHINTDISKLLLKPSPLKTSQLLIWLIRLFVKLNLKLNYRVGITARI